MTKQKDEARAKREKLTDNAKRRESGEESFIAATMRLLEINEELIKAYQDRAQDAQIIREKFEREKRSKLMAHAYLARTGQLLDFIQFSNENESASWKELHNEVLAAAYASDKIGS